MVLEFAEQPVLVVPRARTPAPRWGLSAL